MQSRIAGWAAAVIAAGAVLLGGCGAATAPVDTESTRSFGECASGYKGVVLPATVWVDDPAWALPTATVDEVTLQLEIDGPDRDGTGMHARLVVMDRSAAPVSFGRLGSRAIWPGSLRLQPIEFGREWGRSVALTARGREFLDLEDDDQRAGNDLWLQPGDRLTCRLELGQLFALPRSGRYSLTARVYLNRPAESPGSLATLSLAVRGAVEIVARPGGTGAAAGDEPSMRIDRGAAPVARDKGRAADAD